jgi:hypothetical protein
MGIGLDITQPAFLNERTIYVTSFRKLWLHLKNAKKCYGCLYIQTDAYMSLMFIMFIAIRRFMPVLSRRFGFFCPDFTYMQKYHRCESTGINAKYLGVL